LKSLVQALQEAFPEGVWVTSGREPGNAPPQAELLGDPDKIRKAVEATANTSEAFPGRKDYLTYGYAIKAAMGPDRAQEAFDLWWGWCSRWADKEPNYDFALGDWERMHPPFDVGRDYVFQKAYRHSNGKFTLDDVWFEHEVTDADRAELEIAKGPIPEKTKSRHYDLLTIEDLFSLPKPVWAIERHVPARSMGFLYGAPGAGKSFIALDWALSIAFGLQDWHGDRLNVDDDSVVIYLAGEGSFDFPFRVAAWMDAHKIPAGQRGRFRLVYESVNLMSEADVVRLGETLQEGILLKNQTVAMVIVDTVSRSMPGADENLQKEMSRFVQSCDLFKDRFGCVVLGVHHAGKGGDMRGSTVLSGAGDFVFKLERKPGASVGYLICEKQKAAADGWQQPYRFDVVALAGGGSSLVPVRVTEGSVGGADGSGASMTPTLAAAILRAMNEAWDADAAWSASPRAGARYAVRHMTGRFGMSADAAASALKMWVETGLVREEQFSTNRKMKGLRSGQVDDSKPGLFD
jgi:hypothetical protein